MECRFKVALSLRDHAIVADIEIHVPVLVEVRKRQLQADAHEIVHNTASLHSDITRPTRKSIITD